MDWKNFPISQKKLYFRIFFATHSLLIDIGRIDCQAEINDGWKTDWHEGLDNTLKELAGVKMEMPSNTILIYCTPCDVDAGGAFYP